MKGSLHLGRQFEEHTAMALGEPSLRRPNLHPPVTTAQAYLPSRIPEPDLLRTAYHLSKIHTTDARKSGRLAPQNVSLPDSPPTAEDGSATRFTKLCICGCQEEKGELGNFLSWSGGGHIGRTKTSRPLRRACGERNNAVGKGLRAMRRSPVAVAAPPRPWCRHLIL